MTGPLLWGGSAAALILVLALLMWLFGPWAALLVLFLGLPLLAVSVANRRKDNGA